MTNTHTFRSIVSRWFLLFGETIYLLPVLIVPILFSAVFNSNTLIVKEPALHLCIIFLLLWICLRFVSNMRRVEIQFIPLPLCAILVLFWMYLWLSKTYISDHPNGIYEFFRWTCYLLLFLVFFLMTANRQRLRLFVFGLIMVSFAVSAYALLQTQEWFLPIDSKYLVAWESFEFELGGVRRVTSSLCNPDYLAGYLVAVFPVTFVSILVFQGVIRYASLLIAVMQIVSLLFTYSRGGWITMFITCMILFSLFVYINWIRDPVIIPTKLKPRLLITVLLVFIFSGLSIMVWQWDQVYAALYRIAYFGSGHSVSSRPYFYEGALNMILASPLVGHGIGMFGVIFPQYRSAELSRMLPFQEWSVDHTHNEYLEIGSETGLIGLILYSILLLYLATLLWRTLMTHRKIESLLLLGIGCGVFATMFHNLFTVTLRFAPSAFLFWSFLGVIAGYSCRQLYSNRKPQRKSILAGLIIVTLVSVPFVYSHTIKYFIGDHLIEYSRDLRAQMPKGIGVSDAREVIEESLVALKKGSRFAPHIMRGYFYQSDIYNRTVHDYILSEQVYTQVESLSPSFTSTRRNICVNYLQQAQSLRDQGEMFAPLFMECITEAKKWAMKAIESDPLEPEHHYLLGKSLRESWEMDDARKAFQRAIELIPHMPPQSLKVTVQECEEELAIIDEALFRLNEFRAEQKSE